MNTPNVNQKLSTRPRVTAKTGRSHKVKNILVVCLRYLLPIVALAAGILITLHLLDTGPEAKPMPVKKNRVLVETTVAHLKACPTMIQAMGVVKASLSTALKPQVSGQVISISEKFMPGGKFVKGDTLVELDPSDYQLSLRQQENEVVQAKNNLVLEQGNQLVVKRELDLLGEEVTEAEEYLMLRQPQLSTLQTELEIARAKREQAELNLARTAIKAPYNGVVQAREVNIGTWVSTASVLATLIGSDSYWVEVSVPEELLQWIVLPSVVSSSGSMVKIYNPTAWSDDTFRQGRVVQLLPGLETQGRMARLLVEVTDPLAMTSANQGKPHLLIDSFVRVVIEGKPVAQAVELSREFLRSGDRVWVFGQEGKLDIREVEVAFKNKNSVLITSGITQGEEVIVSDISAPVSGMALQHVEGKVAGSSGLSQKTIAMHLDAESKGVGDE